MKQQNLFEQETTFTPAKTYFGRKGAEGVWQRIISEIPQCKIFIECMAGSGYISSLVEGCEIIVNDFNPEVIEQIRKPIDRITFISWHYKKVIDRYCNGNQERVFYFDPPYLMETRTTRRKRYAIEWETKDHKQFLKEVKAMDCPVMISHPSCKLYDQALKEWRKITYTYKSRGGVKEESLYMNFKQPVLLQCFAHVGANFSDRQRIKRKVDRLISRLKNENPKDRAAILSAILKHYQFSA